MKTKKMGTYKKLVLILLAGAAIGGAGGAVLGACVEIFGPGIAAGAEDMPDMLGVLQHAAADGRDRGGRDTDRRVQYMEAERYRREHRRRRTCI